MDIIVSVELRISLMPEYVINICGGHFLTFSLQLFSGGGFLRSYPYLLRMICTHFVLAFTLSMEHYALHIRFTHLLHRFRFLRLLRKCVIGVLLYVCAQTNQTHTDYLLTGNQVFHSFDIFRWNYSVFNRTFIRGGRFNSMACSS